MDLLQFTDKGIYCAAGDFYIDPWKPVARAVITHAHSDHARPGSASYLCHHFTKPLLEFRLGAVQVQSVEWSEPVFHEWRKVSACIRQDISSVHPRSGLSTREKYGWLAGDYKTENDGISGELEIVPCDVIITESTFGLPIYQWKPQQEIFYDIAKLDRLNRARRKKFSDHCIQFGKAQRLCNALLKFLLPFMFTVPSGMYRKH